MFDIPPFQFTVTHLAHLGMQSNNFQQFIRNLWSWASLLWALTGKAILGSLMDCTPL
jgi:uncharacterized RDD family membrane protein YckC